MRAYLAGLALFLFACDSASPDAAPSVGPNDAAPSEGGSVPVDGAGGDTGKRDAEVPDAPVLSDASEAGAVDGGEGDTGAGDVAAPDAPVLQGVSLGMWAKCDGVTDDAVAVATAFAAAAKGAFPLIVDCPARLHIGTDVDRPIFIDSGTTVVFTGPGKFVVDNVLQPAFVIANSSNITLTDWNLEYDASLPVDLKSVGYVIAGAAVPPTGDAPVSGEFNDHTLTGWLKTHRNIVFSGVNSHWLGPSNTSAVFFLMGDSAGISVTGMRAYVPQAAGGDRFIPMLFSIGGNYKSNQTVSATTPVTGAYWAVPHNLTFSNITLDGTYMGWQGSCQDCSFEHVVSQRYGDLQDAEGKNVGGVGKWFAPPHLFYFRFDQASDPALVNKHLVIKDVTDKGVRVGVARDKGGNDSGSGYALSLKIGGVDCTVDGYTSARPDGLLDVLNSDGLTISNVTATYDSSFLNGLYPGWRFPSSPYTNVTFDNVSLTDAKTTPSSQRPMGSATQASNAGIVMKNVSLGLHGYVGAGSVLPTIAGATNELAITLSLLDAAGTALEAQKNSVSLTFQAIPSAVSVGGSSALSWTSKSSLSGAVTCAASGAWTKAVGPNGTQTVTVAAAGTSDYTLTCTDGTSTASATMTIAAQ